MLELNTHDRIKTAMLEVINSTNLLGDNSELVDGMVDALSGSHRTLQQSFFRVFNEAMKEYSKLDCDARNANSIEFAKDITKLEAYFPLI